MDKSKFVEENYGYIIGACQKYHYRCSGYIEFEDFVNHCCLILLYRKAFDTSRGIKPSTFIYKCVEKEVLNILKKHQTYKRKISQENLMSIDFLNNDSHSSDSFRENNLVESYDDYTKEIASDMYKLIMARLTEEQKLHFGYMLQGLTPKDVEKLTGMNHKDVQQKRVMIRRKAKQEIEKYNKVR